MVNVGGRGKQGPRKLASMLREEGVTVWWTTAVQVGEGGGRISLGTEEGAGGGV